MEMNLDGCRHGFLRRAFAGTVAARCGICQI
jgi:hypothetical protein